jgi:hypothetical protein
MNGEKIESYRGEIIHGIDPVIYYEMTILVMLFLWMSNWRIHILH